MRSSRSSRLIALPGPPPMLNALAREPVDVALGEHERVDEVVDEQDVAHLLAVAVDA